MKKLIFPLMILAVFIAFYQQNSSKPNIIITVICISIFMLGMMKLSAKIPPKDEDDEHRII